MRKNLNSMQVIGRIHSFGENGRNMLELKVSGEKSKNPGTEFISGTINVATDEAGLNVIPVHFTYVTATYAKSGAANKNFTTLKNLISNGKTWIDHGKDGATKVKIDGALALNEFYVEENGEDRLVSAKVNEGSFIDIVNELPADEGERATFKTDMLITRTKMVEADEEKGTDAYVEVGGAIFNFRNTLLPITFTVRNPQGMNYFESLDIEPSEPVYTKVWGKINCSTEKKTTTEESAFGEAKVTTYEKKVRDWVITGCSREGYAFGDEEVLTVADINTAMQDREVYLADIKKRAEDYKAQSATAAPAAPAAPKAKVGGFTF